MTVAYIDSSAAIKRIFAEPESAAFGRWADRDDIDLVSTHLLETELRRAAHRGGQPQSAVTEVLARIAIYDIPPSLFTEAGLLLPGSPLRSLDAIHLAAALRLGVDVIATYDHRLAEAAHQLGLEVIAPA